MRDPELVARAQHAAARLEAAWERWRAAQGLADTPAQPVVGYVGYALKEPWGQPRAVIGFSADEAERLAEHLESGTVPVSPQSAQSSALTTGQPTVQQWPGSPTGQPVAESQPAEPQVASPPEQARGPRRVQRKQSAESKAKLTADRSLSAIYTVLRDVPASGQEPVRHYGCGGSPPHP